MVMWCPPVTIDPPWVAEYRGTAQAEAEFFPPVRGRPTRRAPEEEVLPDGHFDVVHAHSVFSHSPRHVIEECFAHVGRILAPGGFFDFTFDRTEGEEHQVLHEDFSYRTQTLVDPAARHGLAARLMDDWERLPHRQSSRVTALPEHARTVGA
jgi:SAM-dependent methyltransferase